MDYKSFRVGDYFNIRPTRSYGLTNDHLFKEIGKTPVVVNSTLNNGIGGYSNLEPTEKGNMITFSDTVSAEGIFYQEKPFIGYSHVQGLYPKTDKIKNNILDENNLLYLVAAFKKSATGIYDYNYKFTRNNALNTNVYLPVSSNGDPDWYYMDKYITDLKKNIIKKDIFPLLNEESSFINDIVFDIYYDEIRLGDYFEINRGKRLKKDDRLPGTLPFITAGVENNGISSYIDINSSIPITNGPSISVDMFGWANAKDYIYGYDDHVVSVSNKKLNIYQLIYISAAITKSTYNNGKYTWQIMVTKDRLADEKIVVPKYKKSNDICWEYMDLYIRNLLIKQKKSLKESLYQC